MITLLACWLALDLILAPALGWWLARRAAGMSDALTPTED